MHHHIRQIEFSQAALPWHAGPPGAALLGDMFGIFHSGGMSGSGLLPSPPQDLARALSQPQRHPQYLGGGSSSLANLQALREASQRPWNPSAPVTGGNVTTGQLLKHKLLLCLSNPERLKSECVVHGAVAAVP